MGSRTVLLVTLGLVAMLGGGCAHDGDAATADPGGELTSLKMLERVDSFYSRMVGHLITMIGILIGLLVGLAAVVQWRQNRDYGKLAKKLHGDVDAALDELRREGLDRHCELMAVQSMSAMNMPFQCDLGFVLLTVANVLKLREETSATLHPFLPMLRRTLQYCSVGQDEAIRNAREIVQAVCVVLARAGDRAETTESQDVCKDLKKRLEDALAAPQEPTPAEEPASSNEPDNASQGE